MQLFFNSEITLNSQQISFDKNESRHIIRVLRKIEGDKLFITNGKGYLFTTEIICPNEKKCIVKIVNSEEKPKPWKYYLHIAIAPTKLNDRFEWFLEKATEIGIDEITPIICDNSERQVLKMERMNKILISATKQSLKFHLPKLNNPIKFNLFINSNFNGQLFIAHCEDNDKISLNNSLEKNSNATILIGPEGDFSKREIDESVLKGFSSITLGNSRLRTETAGIVAVHSVTLLNN